MKISKYTTEQIEAENKAREALAYDRIKSYIIEQQNRFLGACDYSIRRIKAQCNPCHSTNRYLSNPNSHVRKYLGIPSQTLADLAGFYLRTSRSETKRRIPYQTIIERLEQEGVVQVIEGSRKEKRANIYAIPVQSVYRIKERIAQVQKPENDKPSPWASQDKPDGHTAQDVYRAQMSRMTDDKFFRLCVLSRNAHFYDEIDRGLYAETYMRLKDYYFGDDEKLILRHLREHGVAV